jgi:flagellar biosynthesis/type III secretory pathway chaperone
MTPNVEPAHCRDSLGKLLADEAALLATLEVQLNREYQMLSDNDVDGLEAAGNERQACVAKLLKVEDERRALCRMFDQPADLKGVETLIAWCDPQAQLLPALRECAERATRCRDQNVRNGVLVGARLQRVSNMLGMLNGSGSETQVYGRTGAGATPSPRAGRMVSASA